MKNPQSEKANWSNDIAVLSSDEGIAVSGGNYFNDSIYWDNFLLTPYIFNAEGGTPTDCYLISTDQNANIKWAKKFGSIAEDYLSALDVDDSANIYSVGYFSNDLYFDSDTLSIYAPQGPYPDVFITKHDSSGNLIWTKSLYGTWYEKGEDIHVVDDGILVSGNFGDSLYADSIAILESGSWSNFFLAKYDLNGNVQWLIHSYGKYYFSFGEAFSKIQSDTAGNIYISGHFQDSIAFGNQLIYAKGNVDAFLACFDSSGNIKWLKNIAGANTDFITGFVAKGTSLYLSGTSMDTVWVGSQPFFAGYDQSAFYLKMDSDAEVFLFEAKLQFI